MVSAGSATGRGPRWPILKEARLSSSLSFSSAADFWPCLLNNEAVTASFTKKKHIHSSACDSQVCAMTDTNRGHPEAENDVTASQVAAVCLIQVQFSYVSTGTACSITYRD
jgi:hypothetical protein